VAKLHARVADARRDFHHQLSARLIRENQAVVAEDLKVAGLRHRARPGRECALNILAAGRAVAACGPDARPPARVAAGVEAGTTLAGAA
jgi:transposase